MKEWEKTTIIVAHERTVVSLKPDSIMVHVPYNDEPIELEEVINSNINLTDKNRLLHEKIERQYARIDYLQRQVIDYENLKDGEK